MNDAQEGREAPDSGPRKLDWLGTNKVIVYVDSEKIRQDHMADALAEVLCDTVVLRAEYQYERAAMMYVLAARRFPATPFGEMLPEYEIVFTRDEVPLTEAEKAAGTVFKTRDVPIGIRPKL